MQSSSSTKTTSPTTSSAPPARAPPSTTSSNQKALPTASQSQTQSQPQSSHMQNPTPAPPPPAASHAQRTAEARNAITASLSSVGANLDADLQSRARNIHGNAKALQKQELQLAQETKTAARLNDEMERMVSKAARDLGGVRIVAGAGWRGGIEQRGAGKGKGKEDRGKQPHFASTSKQGEVEDLQRRRGGGVGGGGSGGGSRSGESHGPNQFGESDVGIDDDDADGEQDWLKSLEKELDFLDETLRLAEEEGATDDDEDESSSR